MARLKKELVQRGHRREVAGRDGFDGCFKAGEIVSVGKQLAMIQHIDPDLSVSYHLGGESIFQDLPWSDDSEEDAAFLKVVFDGFPGEFE